MSKYIYSDIIAGIDQKNDLVECWLTLLIKIDDPSNPAFHHLIDLNSTSFAMVGLAAVEQYAAKKLIRQGYTERFRLRAFNLFKSVREFEIFENGQLQTLEKLQQQKPELAEWVKDAVNEIRNKKEIVRVETIFRVKNLLFEIKSQQARKGHKGGRIQAIGGNEKNPAIQWRDLVDSELMNSAVGLLPPSNRNDLSKIKAQVRGLVRDWINRGVLRSGHLTISEATDMHCKRIVRKLDKLCEQNILPVIASSEND